MAKLVYSFNSKLVRLKVMQTERTTYGQMMFQFQTGSIKRQGKVNHNRIQETVSIPNWFD